MTVTPPSSVTGVGGIPVIDVSSSQEDGHVMAPTTTMTVGSSFSSGGCSRSVRDAAPAGQDGYGVEEDDFEKALLNLDVDGELSDI